MKTNVGIVDRILRVLLGICLMAIGLIWLKGLEGDILGIAISLFAILPLFMAFTRKCIVFHWLNIHSLSKKEKDIFGDPCK